MTGGGDAPPLLLYGHVDVVTTDGQRSTHPPFDAQLVDGEVGGSAICIWEDAAST
jgi:acetylornithine deacetylase/succinyl-diaminopimelate desuccinylase-like protein